MAHNPWPYLSCFYPVGAMRALMCGRFTTLGVLPKRVFDVSYFRGRHIRSCDIFVLEIWWRLRIVDAVTSSIIYHKVQFKLVIIGIISTHLQLSENLFGWLLSSSSQISNVQCYVSMATHHFCASVNVICHIEKTGRAFHFTHSIWWVVVNLFICVKQQMRLTKYVVSWIVHQNKRSAAQKCVQSDMLKWITWSLFSYM